MKWFRSNISHGSRLALFALVIQFAFAFGHFHGSAARAAPAIQSGTALSDATTQLDQDAVSETTRQLPAPNDDSGRQPNDACAICVVVALANAALFATPPLLLLPRAVEFLYQATDAEFVHLKSARVAFQPRAPPAS